MAFNKNTWTTDYTKSPGLRQLAKQDGQRKYKGEYKAPAKKTK